MGQADRVHPGRNWLCCGSWKYLEISLSLQQKWRRWEAKLASHSQDSVNEETLISSSSVICANHEFYQEKLRKYWVWNTIYTTVTLLSNFQNICERLIVYCCAIVKQKEFVLQLSIISHMLLWLIHNIVLKTSSKMQIAIIIFTRCISGAIFNHADVFGDASVIHGVNVGSIPKERSCPSHGCYLPVV